MDNESKVCLVKAKKIEYPGQVECFRPSEAYPEISALGFGLAKQYNAVYEAVREGFHLMGFDSENYSKASWNPLKELVRPGDKVLIKPNLVMHTNALKQGGDECLYTQPSVVAPVIDYVLLALKGQGRIVVADAPMQSCDFNQLVKKSGYSKMISVYRESGVDIELLDLRELTSVAQGDVQYTTIKTESDARVIDLGEDSEFASATESELKRMRITCYDPRILSEHHNSERHEYYVSQQLLDADVVINMPKPKTHRKAGMTGSLKNMVGISARKEYLPHHTMGSAEEGGDEYATNSALHKFSAKLTDQVNLLSAEKRYGKARFMAIVNRLCLYALRMRGEQYFEGSFWGNDTISRTIVDLNKTVLYADKNGMLHDKPVRKVFTVADMIISGEKEGPIAPSAKQVGYIAMGENSVCFDETIATFMGFDFNKIPSLRRSRAVAGKYQIVTSEKPMIVSNVVELQRIKGTEIPKETVCPFIPTTGWKGHIERE